MNDPVNKPNHYLMGGLEVIDVIEAYDLPYHLGNVIKYILRHAYKGKPLQDLQKARWYLDRYLEDMEDIQAIEERRYEPTVNHHEFMESLENEDIVKEGDRVQWENDSETRGTVIRGPSAQGHSVVEWDLCDDEGEHIVTVPASKWLRVITPPERIAGSTDAAQAIKNDYYDHDPDEVCGQCAYCYTHLTACEVYVSADRFDDLKFCGPGCLARMVDWQKGIDE